MPVSESLRRPLARLAAVAMLVLPCAMASAQDLRLGTRLQLPTMDPHFFGTFATASSPAVIWERLVDLDEQGRPVAALAAGWRVIDDLTWEFALRRGVTFHDGTPFTAADVAYSFARPGRLERSPSSYSRYLAGTTLEVVDDHTVRVRTAAPAPFLLHDLAYIFIAPSRHADAATTQAFEEGRFVIGTGPYRFVSWARNERLDVARFDGHRDGPAPWARVTERAIPRDASRVAALLANDLDVIGTLPASDMATLRANPALRVFAVPSTTTLAIALDSVRDTSPQVTAKDGSALPRNPLRDRRVRQALSLAINRGAIADRVMAGTAVPAGQITLPGLEGAHPRLPPDPYDPARAQALLREAGWPDGFRIVLNADAGSFLSEAATAQAIAQFWTRIGLAVDVATVPAQVYLAQAGRQEYSAFLTAQGGINAAVPLRSLIASVDPARGLGSTNRSRYSNPAFDAVLRRAFAAMDPTERQGLYEEAADIAAEDVAVLPVFHASNTAASRSGIEVRLWPDRRFNALLVRPAPRP